MVRLSCAKCGRKGQYRKQTLVERYGADIRLPDLREEIAQCGQWDRCTTLGEFITSIWCRVVNPIAGTF
jgi:hypothetical protein